MTKRELLELLADVGDDDTIGAWWDDCEWPITGIRVGEEPEYDYVLKCP